MMSDKAHEAGRAAGLNSTIRALHDELKSLSLTCAPNFPKEAPGGLEFLTDILDVQAIVVAYSGQLLVRLFRSAGRSADGVSSILSNPTSFLSLWEQRGKLLKRENRSENEIDCAIHDQVDFLLRGMLVLGDEELHALSSDEDIPEMLYYLNTVEVSLCWYADRYLARLSGELAKMESSMNAQAGTDRDMQ